MKATYIPTKNPAEAGPEAKKTLAILTDALLEENTSYQLQETAEKIDPNHLCAIVNELKEGVTPEKLAACLARYSRSNEGIENILRKFKDSSPDAIFKFVDYGHASIGGLTGGIAIAIDNLFMLMAYKLFEAAQMADGQESSTRYIELNKEGLPNPEDLGIPNHLQDLWVKTCLQGFDLYKETKDALQKEIDADPNKARLPETALSQPKVKERILKNYALDRCRYFLPLATKTNMAIVATARTWADILKQTEALQWPEAIAICHAIRTELLKASPNLVRHSYADKAAIGFQQQLQLAGQFAAATQIKTHSSKCECHLETFGGASHFQSFNNNLSEGLKLRSNRYSHTGAAIKRLTVQSQWSAIAIAELRDLNRHRTGFRFSTFAPQGFYLPTEVVPRYGDYQKFKENYTTLVESLARQAGPGMQAYGYFLGTQVPFEHTQQADKFLYEVELRTGLGAHFRYAEHLKQAAEKFFALHPETQEYIQIGEAEPE